MNLSKRPYLWFLLPCIIILALIVVYPLIYSVNVSLTDLDFRRPESSFIGLDNFKRLLDDEYFWKTLQNTLFFFSAAVSAEILIGLGISQLLNNARARNVKGVSIFRTLLIIPIGITPVIVGLMWRFLLHEDGIINYILETIGIGRIPWIGNPSWAFFSVIMVDVWHWTPFVVLVLYAGLSAFPVEPFEAAQLDGASRWQTFRHVTFPLLKPLLLMVLLIRTIDSFRIFDEVFVLTAGGPGLATEMVSMYTVRMGFHYFSIGYAAAVSFLILFALLWVYFVYRRTFRMGE